MAVLVCLYGLYSPFYFEVVIKAQALILALRDNDEYYTKLTHHVLGGPNQNANTIAKHAIEISENPSALRVVETVLATSSLRPSILLSILALPSLYDTLRNPRCVCQCVCKQIGFGIPKVGWFKVCYSCCTEKSHNSGRGYFVFLPFFINFSFSGLLLFSSSHDVTYFESGAKNC
jgi:hypothetical protein